MAAQFVSSLADAAIFVAPVGGVSGNMRAIMMVRAGAALGYSTTQASNLVGVVATASVDESHTASTPKPAASLRVNPPPDRGLLDAGASGDNDVMLARIPTPDPLVPRE